MMNAGQTYIEKHGPVRSGAGKGDDDGGGYDEYHEEGYVREKDESGDIEHRDTWKDINKYNKQSKQAKDPKEKAKLRKKAVDTRASLPPKERGPQ
jgi:hypothetical protein